MGSGKPLYGYRLDPISKRYNAFGPEALVIKHMFMYVSLGYTLHQTAEILNTLGARTRNGCVFTPDWILKHILDSRYKGNHCRHYKAEAYSRCRRRRTPPLRRHQGQARQRTDLP